MFFSKIKESFTQKFQQVFQKAENIEQMIEELEETLILSDVGNDVASRVCNQLRKNLKGQKDINEEIIKKELRAELIEILSQCQKCETSDREAILVVGVNGVGKTTSIAKLANLYKQKGLNVLVVAGDTFRAGAVEQLQIWASRVGVNCVTGKEQVDPASVVFDGVKEYLSKKYDICIIDTAGRLHNKKNLMEEIEKIKKTAMKNLETDNIKLKVYIVIDATCGQNAVEQVKNFYDKTNVDGVILTKLDSTAKGGIIFKIVYELKIPILYVGTGEKLEDIELFDANEFVNSII